MSSPATNHLDKAPSGIVGLDKILGGGFPRGRASLVCGGPGCGKTLLALEFILRGARDLGEPGLFIAFEETADELATNVASLGFEVPELVASGRLAIDRVDVTGAEVKETGAYDLEPLLLRVGYGIERVGATRVAIDSLESLFSMLTNEGILRIELHRLLRRLKELGQTVLITGEQGTAGRLTRHGIEEYVSDCVLSLDNRVEDQVSRRRLRVLKYRGSTHGVNEYPFLIDEAGITVVPITSIGLDAPAPAERVPSGIEELDRMLDGGYYRAAGVLVTGPAGSGKTTLAAHFADAVCRSGERCLYFLFEESPAQLLRNMRSVGIDLDVWREQDRLRLVAARPTHAGLEAHLANLVRALDEFDPHAVVIDPTSNLGGMGSTHEIADHQLRQFDLLRTRGITSLATALSAVGSDTSELVASSLADTWIALRRLELDGETNRTLHVVKARGIAHSNQIREFVLRADGVDLVDVYLGPDGILTGSARLKQEQRDAARERELAEALRARRQAVDRHRLQAEAEIARIRGDLDYEEAEFASYDKENEEAAGFAGSDRAALAALRYSDQEGA